MLYGNRVFLYFFFGKVFLGGQQFREAYDGIQWYTDLVSDIFQKILFILSVASIVSNACRVSSSERRSCR